MKMLMEVDPLSMRGSLVMTMASISSSGREFPPVDSCLPESFSLSGVFRLIAAAEYFFSPPRTLGFCGDDIHKGSPSEVGQGGQTHPSRGQQGARAWALSGPMVAHLGLSFWLRLRYGKIGTSAFVSSNSKNISCTTFLKYKNSRKQELAL